MKNKRVDLKETADINKKLINYLIKFEENRV